MNSNDFWVFGYGSLMWRPGFDHDETRMARLYGYHRALCVWSHVHRGTPERPGLVLGLDRGGSCLGMAFRVLGRDREAVMEYLRERELVTSVYRETRHLIRMEAGIEAEAVAYVIDRKHVQYSGPLSTADAVRAVNGAVGQSGANEDYVRNTVEHLRTLKIRDNRLEAIVKALPAARD